MCVILVGKISFEQHMLAKTQNGDGFSVYTKDYGLIKAPSSKVVQHIIKRNMFAIWHYRIATSGLVDESNIHPFKVCGGRYYLYHNGILGEGLGALSDTAALASTLYEVELKTARSVLSSLSKAQRFLLVDAKDPAKFELFGDWSCDAGVLMSHKLYAYTAPAQKSKFKWPSIYEGYRREGD